jgi:hypothetical protein
MSTDSAEPNAAPDEPAPAGRPQSVDWAFYAILATAVLSIANGVARNFAESWVVSNYRKSATYKNESDEKLHSLFVDSKTTTMVTVILIAAILVVLGKFIRDGKRWSRWLLTVLLVLPLLPTAYVFLFTYVFTDAPVAVKVSGGLTGLAAVTAVSLLFVRPSAQFFRKPGAVSQRPSLLGALFKPRAVPAKPVDAQPKAPSANTAGSKDAAPKRAPRAKSRKAAE